MDDEQKKSPAKQTKHFNFRIVKDWIAIAVSIFGIIAFFRGCSHETEINNLNFEVMSLTHQPRLKLIGFPETIRTNIDSLSVNIKERPDKHSGTKSDPHTLNIGFKITIESWIKITNTSANALGKIIALISTDTIPRIKSLITGEYLPDSVKYYLNAWTKFQQVDVLPGDTISLTTTTKIHYVKDNKYILHFIIVYQNGLGNLYHTYVIVPYMLNPIQFKTNVEMKVKDLETSLYKTIKDMLLNDKLMSPVKPISNYETYNQEETQMAKEHLKRLMPDIGLQ